MLGVTGVSNTLKNSSMVTCVQAKTGFLSKQFPWLTGTGHVPVTDLTVNNALLLLLIKVNTHEQPSNLSHCVKILANVTLVLYSEENVAEL